MMSYGCFVSWSKIGKYALSLHFRHFIEWFLVQYLEPVLEYVSIRFGFRLFFVFLIFLIYKELHLGNLIFDDCLYYFVLLFMMYFLSCVQHTFHLSYFLHHYFLFFDGLTLSTDDLSQVLFCVNGQEFLFFRSFDGFNDILNFVWYNKILNEFSFFLFIVKDSSS